MATKLLKYCTLTVIILFLTGCPNSKTAKTVTVKQPSATVKAEVPLFNADSAYHFIEKQVSFGPRVPNSEAHEACGDFLVNALKRYRAEVTVQKANLTGYDGTIYKSRNIIGAYNPDHTDRIILCAHWDTRHVADYDPDENNTHKPIDGANDGGSGVGVLLEIARQLNKNPLPFGIDIIFFDAEDQGRPKFLPHDPNSTNTWCLGSQYWSRTPHREGYSARYGILLDMVGAKDAVFPMEGYSMQYAPDLVNKIWNLASNLGFSQYFIFDRSAPVIDDHYFINTIAKIPCIDIIHYSPYNRKGFGDFWHTHDDNMQVIHKPTLHATGTVVLAHLYQQPF